MFLKEPPSRTRNRSPAKAAPPTAGGAVYFLAMNLFSFDCETHLIKPGMAAPKMVCLSYAEGRTPTERRTGLLLREEGLALLREKLADPDTHFVAHNAPYDFGVAAAADPSLLPAIFEAYSRCRVHDTKLRQQILDNARGFLKFEYDEDLQEYKRADYSLARLVHRHLGKNIRASKGAGSWRLRYRELDGIPITEWPPEAAEYALSDSVYGYDCFWAQEGDSYADLLSREATQTQPDWALHLMSCWGVRTDKEDVLKLRAQLEEEYEAEIAKAAEMDLVYLNREGKWSRNMAAIRALVERHYTKHNLEIPLTAGGKSGKRQTKTDRETLRMRKFPALKAHPGMLCVSEIVRLNKLLTTYIPALERGTDVPINANYNCIIETYRTSCSGGQKFGGVPMGAQLQNPPRGDGVRDCFRARSGYVYLFCDFDTLEMRTLAQVCIDFFGYSEIAKALREGQDLHVALAADMLGLEYGEAFERYERGDELIAEARQFCKIGNYGFGGGMGPEAFIDYARGYGIEVPLERAQALYWGFRQKWAEMQDYFGHCSDVHGLIDPEDGVNHVEFVRSGLVRGDVKYTAICNGYFQNLAAMGAKLSLFQFSWECYATPSSALYGTRGWLFAHDEIGAETPWDPHNIEQSHNAAMRLRDIMVDSMKFWVPDVPISASPALCFRWLKGAKPVYSNGLLVPSRKWGKKWVADFGEERAAA